MGLTPCGQVIGVAKYLDDPYTTRMKFWTAWHHLWFFPLVLWALRDHGYVPPGSYPLQVVLMTVLGGAASVASFWAAILTEIYLCNVCSCQEILRRNGRG